MHHVGILNVGMKWLKDRSSKHLNINLINRNQRESNITIEVILNQIQKNAMFKN
jgi:hypothetical protein